MIHRLCAVVAVVGCVTACGGSKDSTASVSGTVTGLSTQNARVVAVTPQGKAFRGSIDASGRFRIHVPTGSAFRLIVASAPASGLHPVAGHLALANGKRWVSAGSGIALGAVHPGPAAPNPGGITAKSEGSSGGDSEVEDDTEEDDGEDDALCGADSSGDVELHADSEPAESSDADDKAGKDHEDAVAGKTCS